MSKTEDMPMPPTLLSRCLAMLKGISRGIAMAAMTLFVLFLVTGQKPGEPVFAVLIIYIVAVLAGVLVTLPNLGLPPLMGMLIVGIFLANLPYIGDHVGRKVDPKVSSAVRNLALAMILSRAGLSLDVNAVKKLRFVVARLAFIPCCTEACTLALLGWAFWGMTWDWALMFGFTISAISPAVVIPSVLALQDRGYGTTTGIPSMMVASAALDDVISLAAWGIFAGFVNTSGEKEWYQKWEGTWFTYANAPLQIGFGIAFGVLGGLWMQYLISDKVNGPHWRAGWLYILAVIAIFAGHDQNLSGAAALAVLIMAAWSATMWGPAVAKPTNVAMTEWWNNIAQPLLFGLVGATVDVRLLTGSLIGIAIAMLAISILVRCTVTFLAVSGNGLRWQERLFVGLGWCPKATVQAAIGGVAMGWKGQTEEQAQWAVNISVVATLAIIITAPVFASIITAVGPKLLLAENPKPVEEEPATKAASLLAMKIMTESEIQAKAAAPVPENGNALVDEA